MDRPLLLLQHDLLAQRSRSLGAYGERELCASRACNDPIELAAIIGRRTADEPIPEFVGPAFQVPHLLSGFAADQLCAVWQTEFGLERAHSFAFQGLLARVSRQKTAIFEDDRDVVDLLPDRLDGSARGRQKWAERGVGERPLAVFLTHLLEVFQWHVLHIELGFPSANFNRTKLRVFELLPVDKSLAVHFLVVPLHNFEIILFGMPADPGYEVAGRHASRRW